MKLEIGSGNHFEVRHEQCPAAIAGSISVLYLSDLHFKTYGQALTTKIISRINELDPGIILLGGDYVDFARQLIHLDMFLKALSQRKNVFAIAGNHDYRFGVATIQKMMEANNIRWIENDSVTVSINGSSVQIDGTRPLEKRGGADFSILCLHQPIDVSHFADKYELIFAGHLHGCQFVFWQNEKGLYPGRFFFRWNTLQKKLSNCRYYISRGLGDTIPLRFNCPKEMIFVEVINPVHLILP
jgi:predicted MPP superfamily phosphohydrolase